MNSIFLNGPINYIKLYNEEKNKYLYVFMDYHEKIDYQQKCDSLHSIDIDKYLHHILEEADINIDFFLEIYPTSINNNLDTSTNYIYLGALREKFKKLYNDLEIKKKKNIRLHYIDIRAYTLYENLANSIDLSMNNFTFINPYNINNLIYQINYIFKEISYLFGMITKIKDNGKILENKIKIDLIKREEKINTNLSYNQIEDHATFQILEKILIKYDDNKNKENINNLFQKKYIDNLSYLITYVDKFLIKLKDIQKLVNYYYYEKKIVLEEQNLDINTFHKLTYYTIPNEENIRIEIKKELDKIYFIILNLGAIIVDCFFLRRFVDKSYIKNGIVYTGAAHSTVYIWVLIKFYNYKITEYDYLKNITVDKLYEIILSSDNPYDIEEYLYPENFKQCVHLKKRLFEE
jgi:hypothetical protein